jgi:ATP-dependent RNA helicase RhlB
VQRGIDDAGFIECTPIQAQTLPLALEGHDIAGQAQTGTGKTAAFLIATFTQLLRAEPRYKGEGCCPRAVILAPTRELAMQIYEEALLLGKYVDLKCHVVFGGVDYEKQRKAFEDGVDILIGTPGRLIDYFKQHVFTMKDTEIFICDEADRMFDMGFIDDLRFIVRKMPKAAERHSYLYSATLSHRVLELAYEHMKSGDVQRVVIDEDQVTAENIEQMVYHVGNEEKFPLLLGLLKRENPDRALIFANTRTGCAMLADRLRNEGFVADALIGDLPQKKRMKLLQDFKDQKVHILVATDVASRGLHIEAVTHVFNYDLPQDPEDYVHRIGRTARAGASGKAFSLACERYVYSLEAIHEYTGLSLPYEFADEPMLAKPKPWRRPPSEDRDGRGGRGRSGSGSGRGSRSGDSGRSGRGERRPRSSESEAPAASADAPSAEGSEAPRRKRRRRRSGEGGEAVAAVEGGAAMPAAQGDGAGAEGQAAPKKRKRRRRKKSASGQAVGAEGGGSPDSGSSAEG